MNDSFDSNSQSFNVEVDKQPDFPSTQTQIGQKLCFMDWEQLLHALDFNDHSAGNQQIDAIAAI